MAKTKNPSSSSQPPVKEPAKKLSVTKPPISKQSKGKEKKKSGVEILYVKSDSVGRHIGYSSLDPTRFVLAPSAVCRADGDMEKDTPPPSPNRDDTNIFTIEKPYDFNGPFRFGFAKDKELFGKLVKAGKKPLPLLFPTIDALEQLGKLEEIQDMLSKSRLTLVLREDPGFYHLPTMEFISSFTLVIKVDEADGEETVEAWKFTLCGYNWEIDAQVLRDWFRFPKDGLFPRVIDERVYRFWKRISRIDYDKDEHHYSTKIKVPIWKLIHKILGGIIFVRSNYGRTVKKLEMTVMMMMEKEQEVDWLWCITHGLRFNQEAVQNRGMGVVLS